jgi:hypothetical protein
VIRRCDAIEGNGQRCWRAAGSFVECHLTIRLERSRRWWVELTKEWVDDGDKSVSFRVGATARRSALSLDGKFMSAPLLVTTKQLHKLYAAGACLAAGVGAMYLASFFVASVLLVVLLVAGTSIAIAAALYALRSVRCPKCKITWVQWSMGHQPVGSWLHWLLAFSECPGCGYVSPDSGSATRLTIGSSDRGVSSPMSQGGDR